MEMQVVIWAFLNGILAGAVGVGIVLNRRHRRIAERHVQALGDVRDRLDQLDEMRHRLADVEERLDFTERRLGQPREPDLR